MRQFSTSTARPRSAGQIVNARIAALGKLQRGEIDVATTMADPRQLTTALVLIMSIQASTGLLFQRAYRDADWITATWFGNDWFTLVAAVPVGEYPSWT